MSHQITLKPSKEAELELIIEAQAQTIARLMETIFELQQKTTSLQRLASTDPMTGILNRRGLNDLPDGADGYAIIMIDVDKFKSINDTYGHPVGDAALIHISKALKAAFKRQTDYVFRLGGDEFAVFVLEGGGREQIEGQLDTFLTALNEPTADGITVRVSIGVCCDCSGKQGNYRDYQDIADRALIKAKANKSSDRIIPVFAA